MNVHKQIGGNWVFDSPVATAPTNPATIRNIGNTYLRMTIKEMTWTWFNPINGVTTWNVMYISSR